MNEKNIKAIPKHIIKLIKKNDNLIYPEQRGNLRFYSYLTIWNKELVKVTVAVKTYKKQWYYKQVTVHGLDSEKCIVKDMEYCGYVGMGYRVGWYEQGLSKYRSWYESENWGYADDKYYNPYSVLVNLNFLEKLPQYKYSCYMLYRGCDILKYLRIYNKYPQTEYLLKLDLHSLADSITVLKLIGKDKKFCKWLIKHRQQIADNSYYVSTIIGAYKSNKDFDTIQAFEKKKKQFERDDAYKDLKELFKGKTLEQFFLYLDKQITSARSYLDYYNACKYLNIDLSKEKNIFPKDFKRWHDIRIDEFNSAKAIQNEKEKQKLFNDFYTVASKYIHLEFDKKVSYVAIIAKSPDELIFEGEKLNHCVGRMNYDQKMLREETLIFFIRDCTNPLLPLVTVEYSPTKRKVLQCYGNSDSKPNDSILDFVNKKWLPYANRQLKKLKVS